MASWLFDHRKVERKWQGTWEKEKSFKFDSKHPSVRRSRTSPLVRGESRKKKKYYALDMFPYPSGAGLHVGHPLSYTATDIHSRYLRMNGWNVLHPMGFDAFGLPAENYAIKTQVHPERSTLANIKTFRKQLKGLGFSYDWDREVSTCLPDYYKWTQWFFSFFYKEGLAYKKKSPVNWCKSCKTVLANEQVVDEQCERCGTLVKEKKLDQWYFRITDFIEDCYADRRGSKRGLTRKTHGLLSGLDTIEWPNSTKIAQRNWIGKSEGAMVKFQIANSKFQISSRSQDLNSKQDSCYLEVFTTRPDTLFGVTYMVVSPEHPLVKALTVKKYVQKVSDYVRLAKKKTNKDRVNDDKEKTGVFTGSYCINPVNGEEIPVWVADYVLMGYGTGAIMAVPAHDERDWAFAAKYKIDMVQVIAGEGVDLKESAYCGDGKLVNSGAFDGMSVKEGKKAITSDLAQNKQGRLAVQYKVRDWLVSRQRYWGAPIPVVYDDKGDHYLIPESELPVKLPKDVDFMPTGESPLVNSKQFHNEKDLLRIEKRLKKLGQLDTERSIVRRESDTMDTFVCSSWYFWRFMDPSNNESFCDSNIANTLGPVDLYVGGAEHTVLHLLYARFFCKALHRAGIVDYDEPFAKLRHQGMILGEDGEKMSKSRGNVINPDHLMKEYGADTVRVYEMFMGPFEHMKPWASRSVAGVRRFLDKVWKLQGKVTSKSEKLKKEEKRIVHKTIKKVTEDIESFSFNTAVSAMMILVNSLNSDSSDLKDGLGRGVSGEAYALLLKLLYPFAPHVCEELWERVGFYKKIMDHSWPKFNSRLAKDDEIDMPVQVNGKMRGTMRVAADISESDALKKAKVLENVADHLEGKKVMKEIFVPGKIVNIVAS
jgi:leucyl-tRNA synthetase